MEGFLPEKLDVITEKSTFWYYMYSLNGNTSNTIEINPQSFILTSLKISEGVWQAFLFQEDPQT